MIEPKIVFGRLGNSMFQYAALYAYAKDLGVDFYFQDEKHFKKYEEDIKTLFGSDIGFLPYVSIHVRRGSNPINPSEPKYSENPFYVKVCETDYYEKAIAMFPNDKFLVFSDDPDWCKIKWGDDNRFQIMEGGSELEDFNMMSSCKSNIITNSTFSWWAAWLNPNYGKTVVAPKMWFTDGIQRTKLPKEWIQI